MEDSGETEIVVRPYTEGSFQSKIDEFVIMLKEMTMQGAEATPEERRQMISGETLIQNKVYCFQI